MLLPHRCFLGQCLTLAQTTSDEPANPANARAPPKASPRPVLGPANQVANATANYHFDENDSKHIAIRSRVCDRRANSRKAGVGVTEGCTKICSSHFL